MSGDWSAENQALLPPKTEPLAKREKTLSLVQMLAFALPALPTSFLSGIWGVYTFDYWNVYCRFAVPVTNLGLAYGCVAALLLLPVFPSLLDGTSTRWGRRKPWIPTSYLITAIAQIFLFLPPTFPESWASFVSSDTFFTLYFAIFYALVVISFVWVFCPAYVGFGWELTEDFDTRSTLLAWMQIFQVAGAVGGMAIPSLLTNYVTNQRTLFLWLNVGFSVFSVVSFLPLLVYLKEPQSEKVVNPMPVATSIKLLFHSKPSILFLLACNILTWAPTYVQYLPFWIQFVAEASKDQQSLLLSIVLVASFVSTPFWTWLSKGRLEKRGAWMISLLVGAVGYLGFMVPVQSFWLALAVVFLTGWAMMPIPWNNFLVESIQGDVIDYDEFRTGMRREALYFTASQYANWLLSPLSSNLPFSLMALSGFDDSSEDKSPTVLYTLRGIMSAGAFFCLAALCVWYFYPLNRENHKQILEGVKAHQLGESAVDPISGKLVPSFLGKTTAEMEVYWSLLAFGRVELRYATRNSPNRFNLLGLLIVQLTASILFGVGVILVWVYFPQTYWICGYLLVIAVHTSAFTILRIRVNRQLGELGVGAERVIAFLDNISTLESAIN